MTSAKHQCLDGEGAEEALRQAQENVARLQRQIEESARQVASPAVAPPPASNLYQSLPAASSQSTALPQPPADIQLSPSVVTVPAVQPQPAILPPQIHTQPSSSAPVTASNAPADQRNTPYRMQPSFASALSHFDNNFRGGRAQQHRTDTRGRMFYVYVCRNHSGIYCQICGEYLAAPEFFDRNPDYEY